MSNRPPTGTTRRSDAAFDRMARSVHADALDHVSPAVRMRLQQARHAATQPARTPRRSLTWVWAGSTAVLALALGAGLQFQRPTAPAPAAPALATVPLENGIEQMIDDDEQIAAMLAALDENPDFYLWLAANDSALPPPSER